MHLPNVANYTTVLLCIAAFIVLAQAAGKVQAEGGSDGNISLANENWDPGLLPRGLEAEPDDDLVLGKEFSHGGADQRHSLHPHEKMSSLLLDLSVTTSAWLLTPLCSASVGWQLSP